MKQSDSIADRKKTARREAGKVRQLAHQQLKETAGHTLADLGLSFAGDLTGLTVSGFIPYLSEIDTRPLLSLLAANGLVTSVPVVIKDQCPLEFRAWVPGDPTIAGRWGIPIPPVDAAVVEPDILLVPMLAFDELGYRLGYGGGFYDRTLEKLRAMKPITAIGVAYSAQQTDAVVRGPHDQPLDWVLTEKGPFRPGKVT